MEFDTSTLYDAQDLAVKLLIEKIDKPSEDAYRETNPDAILDAVFSWPRPDGEPIYTKINELNE